MPRTETPDRPALEPLLDLRGLAGYLGLSASAVYALRGKGQCPPGFKVGGQLRFRRTEVDQWLADRRDDVSDRIAG